MRGSEGHHRHLDERPREGELDVRQRHRLLLHHLARLLLGLAALATLAALAALGRRGRALLGGGRLGLGGLVALLALANLDLHLHLAHDVAARQRDLGHLAGLALAEAHLVGGGGAPL